MGFRFHVHAKDKKKQNGRAGLNGNARKHQRMRVRNWRATGTGAQKRGWKLMRKLQRARRRERARRHERDRAQATTGARVERACRHKRARAAAAARFELARKYQWARAGCEGERA
jgi:hypothetical protein